MGLLSMLKAGFDSAKAGLDGEVAKFRNADAVNASLAIVALVAGADGEFEPQEKEILREVCDALGLNAADFRGLA